MNSSSKHKDKILLSIAIPTRNRHTYLDKSLKSLNEQIKGYDSIIEIIVSDNSDNNLTQNIVEKYKALNLKIRYKRNLNNIGSDANVAQCFNMSSGKYVHIFCDDDIYCANTLHKVLDEIKKENYGCIFLRPYGFYVDHEKEYPLNLTHKNEPLKIDDFLVKISSQMTLASANIINKSLIKNIDANDYCGTNLVQVNLLLDAATKSKSCYYFKDYIIAIQKNNSGGYDLYDVFINKFGSILQSYVDKGLISENLKKKIECKNVKCFFPSYIFRSMYYLKEDLSYIENKFEILREYSCYKFFILPIFKLPYNLAISWCFFVTIYGRFINGDIALLLKFIKNIKKEKIFK
jgi:abequosyltransferase